MCEAIGDPPIEIIWLKDKRKLAGGPLSVSESAAEYSIEQKTHAHLAQSWLTIAAASREDSAMYTCVAANAHGQDETNIQLFVHEPPDAPSIPHISDLSARAAKITWQPPYNVNGPIQSYIVQWKALDDNTASETIWRNTTVRGNECLTQLQPLFPATEYEVRVIAINAYGQSVPSASLSLRTEEEAPTSAPSSVRLAALSTRSVRVSWQSPDRRSLNGRLRGYYVGYRLVSSSNNGAVENQFVYKTVEATSSSNAGYPSGEQTVLTNLRKNSKYSIVVQAYNAKGAGPTSEEQQVITAELDPPETPALQVQSTSSSSVQLAWQSIMTDDNLVDGYLLYQRQETSSEWREYTLDAQQTFYTAIGLHCGTRYVQI